ncbi:zinc knuckle CX2CX4HX4C containing protein, partial [Tanacetum coccineum]
LTSHVSSGFVGFAIEGHGEGDQSRDSVAESASIPSEGFVNPNVNADSYTNPNSVSSSGDNKGLKNPNATYTNILGRGADVSQPQTTNDDRFDATSRYFSEVNPYIHDHEDKEEIDAFVKDLELGKHELWTIMSKEKSNVITEIVCNKWDALLKAMYKGDDTRPGTPPSDPIVQYVDINTKSTSYAGAAGAIVEKVSTRFEHTLYGYFIGKRLEFLVVEYYARNNWGKHGLKRIMMNTKGFFFFKFDSKAGLEAILESGPWMIHNTLIILKKWSMATSLFKEELTRIPIWVKLHDVPFQVFEEDGISLIATFIDKPIMLDSYTSFMCNDSWGRSSFSRCLIEVNSQADLMDVVTIGIPSLTGDDFTKETVHVEYEWRLPKCDECKIFGHIHDHCPKKVASPLIVTTSNVVTPTVEKSNDGFQTVGKKKKRKGKSKSTKGGQFAGPSVKHNIRYEPKSATIAPKKGATNVGNASKSASRFTTTITSSKNDNIITSNSYYALNDEEEDEEEEVENMYDKFG